MLRRMFAKPVTWVVVGLLGVAFAAGLYWFAPWRLFTSTTVHDALSSPVAVQSPTTAARTSAPPAGPVVLRQGAFVTHEHATAGTARLVRNADGSHQLELVGLDTSDGPDLRVWLTDQDVRTGAKAWQVFDDGRYVELGRLKGNKGDQVYQVPKDVDLSAYRSVTIWCKRFSVSFGAAQLA